MSPAQSTGPGEDALRPRSHRWEVADILHLHGQAYRDAHSLPASHLAIMRAIERCRTAALGGHLEECGHCGFQRPAYNSCRNRHCPKCQALTKARWLEARRSELLPVAYFHVVFTLPHELNGLILINKRLLLNALFRAVAHTLQAFGRNNLGGKLGFTAVLHTWDQSLGAHFHLHCLVPAGVLANDNSRFVHAPDRFLFPVKALAKVFRGKFLDLVNGAFHAGKLDFCGQSAYLRAPDSFSSLLQQLRAKDWVVYAKAPFAGPEQVLGYLGRYTHRVAISNNRILDVGDDSVTFAYRDRRDGNKRKVMTLSAGEFIRRFLLHCLPASFVRIRHFGFLANRAKGNDLPMCRRLLGAPPRSSEPPKRTDRELLRELTGRDPALCPNCHQGQMSIVADLPRFVASDTLRPDEFVWDSS